MGSTKTTVMIKKTLYYLDIESQINAYELKNKVQAVSRYSKFNKSRLHSKYFEANLYTCNAE